MRRKDVHFAGRILTKRQVEMNDLAWLYPLLKSATISFVHLTFLPIRGLDHSDVKFKDGLE